jgi:predicted RNase H-like nuclease
MKVRIELTNLIKLHKSHCESGCKDANSRDLLDIRQRQLWTVPCANLIHTTTYRTNPNDFIWVKPVRARSKSVIPC